MAGNEGELPARRVKEEFEEGRSLAGRTTTTLRPARPGTALVVVSILSLIVAVFWQTTRHDFVYDDRSYILSNPRVSSGISWPNFVWSLTTGYFATWHPLTWLSHMLDVSLFGLKAAGHHLVNVILHALNALLLILAFRVLTSSFWKSALVAALFAVHPLHVETVAWVADRKDLLHALFFLLALVAYQWYCRAPGVRRYLAVVLAFSLGILAKASMVSLPLVLLLLDFWPLNRAAFSRERRNHRLPGSAGRSSWFLVREKIPLLALSLLQALVIYRMQSSAAVALETPPLLLRLANAVVSYSRYLGKTVVPLHLTALYPFPQTMPPGWLIALAVFVLAVPSAWAFLQWKQRPYLALGWFWYLATLFPVSGVVQIGSGTQSMADRFTYVPLIGIFLIAAWTIGASASGSPRKTLFWIVACGSLFAPLTYASFRQAGYWKDSVTLWERALRVTNRNYVAHNNLGMAYIDRGRFREAEEQFRQACTIKPDYTDASYNLGTALYAQKRFGEALTYFRLAREASPRDVEYNFGLAAAYMELGRCRDALGPLRTIVEINRGYKDASRRLAFCLQQAAPHVALPE